MKLHDVLVANHEVWKKQPGASQAAIEALRVGIRIQLPEEYLEFLIECDGGTGWTVGQEEYFILHSAQEVLDFNTNPAYRFGEFYPGYFVFGSDGSNGRLAFKTASAKPWKVHLFDSFEPEQINKVVGNDFVDFVAKIVVPWPPKEQLR